MKLLKVAIASAVMVAGVALTPNAQAILITPATPNVNGTNSGEGKTDPLNASQVEDILGLASGTLTEAYKSDEDGDSVGTDSGDFAASYRTSFSNPVGDPANATIRYDGSPDPFISGSTIWLAVKDGNHAPWFYLFDISGWDGTEIIELVGFWPSRGAISHVSIFTGGSSVPDAGTTLVLMGAGLLAVAGIGRRNAK